MDWRLKSNAFRLLARMPLGDQLHFFAQRRVARTFPRSHRLLDALRGRAHYFIESFTRYTPHAALADATFVEVGAGRDLSVPIALRLAGVGKVWAFDVTRLAKLDLIRHAATHMTAKADRPEPSLQSWQDVEAFGIHYRAPAGLQSPELSPESVDCICSNEVLEHVDVDGLNRLAADMRSLLKPGGIGVHTIDYSDHYARSDKRIDRFNFLTFDDASWRRHNSAFQYVNRLRHCDYIQIFQSHGLVLLEETLTPGMPTTTTADRVAPRFRHYSEADLFGLNGRIVVGSPAKSAGATSW